MRPTFGREYIENEFKRITDGLSDPLTVYLIGGDAMSLRDLKGATKNIDLVAADSDAYGQLWAVLMDLGYAEVQSLDADYTGRWARPASSRTTDAASTSSTSKSRTNTRVLEVDTAKMFAPIIWLAPFETRTGVRLFLNIDYVRAPTLNEDIVNHLAIKPRVT